MKKGVYIQGASAISVQPTFENDLFNSKIISNATNKWTCLEPDYSTLIDIKKIRRMSRIIRMSIATSIKTLEQSGITQPDAIIVGSALGCLDDTNSFLSKMVQYNEDMLSPTAFIHSTHNTIASQIALHFKCYGYNSTYVHRSISFESALLDAMLLIEEKSSENVLVGGADELIDASYTIMERLGLLNSDSNFGFNAGEGASFFLLSENKNEKSYCSISEMGMWSNESNDVVSQSIKNILLQNNIKKPDLILAGYNGDSNEDVITRKMLDVVSPESVVFNYKSLCGEYGASTSFALWLAASIIKTGKVPNNLNIESKGEPKSILIYNQLGNIHHSAILVEAC